MGAGTGVGRKLRSQPGCQVFRLSGADHPSKGCPGGWFLFPVPGSVGGKRGSAFKEPFRLQLRAFGQGNNWMVLGLQIISALSSCDHLRG